MQREPVTSSQLAAIGYDPDARLLEIEFKKGAVYQYKGVPETVYKGLCDALSKGGYFSANIKSHYPFEKK